MGHLLATLAPDTERTERVCEEFMRMAAEVLRDDTPLLYRIAGTRPMLAAGMTDQALSQEKWDQFKDEPCPVYLRVSWDGPMNSEIPTRCNHWLCVECW